MTMTTLGPTGNQHVLPTLRRQSRGLSSASGTAGYGPPVRNGRNMRVVSVADRPDLSELNSILAARWPRFLLEGHPGHDVDLAELALRRVPEHQVVLLDEAGEPLVGLSLPLSWDGTPARLPTGWDGAVMAAAEHVARGQMPTEVCALSVTMTDAGKGQGLSAT
jgi:hypothetical protein